MTADDLDEEDELTAEPWSWLWLASCTANTLANLGRVVTSAAGEVSTRITQHDLWIRERRTFAESVSRDLERLPVAE
jgi:hypothetical protein